MRNHEMIVFLNGLRMTGKREPPNIEADKFIKAVITDLFGTKGAKHVCSEECHEIWTIAVGPQFNEKNTFMECIPR